MATLLDSLIFSLPLASDFVDEHTNAITFTETSGTVAFADGGADFEAGDTEYLAAADSALLSAPSTSLSISVWVKLESKPGNEMDIVSKFETTGNQREYRIFYTNVADRFRFTITTSGASASSVSIDADNFGSPSTATWYHILAWYDHDQQTIHIQVNDGVPNTALVAAGTGIFDGTSPLHIGALGRASPTNYFDGIVKLCRVAKRVWTSGERTYLHNGGSGRSYADLNATATPSTVNGRLFTNGIWTWFNTPVATYHNGKIYIGAFDCTTAQKARVAEYPISLGAASVVSLSPDIGETDDHDNPAMLRLASGKIFAAWSIHNGDSWCAKSTSSDDASAFDSTVNVNTADSDSYAQCLQATYNSTIYWFFRRNTQEQFFRTSADDGATWSSATQFLANGTERPYGRWWRTSGTRFDFFYTNAHPNEAVASLYHGYMTINASTGAREYFTSDGTSIGDDTALPLGPGDLTQVYDGTTNECWIWDAKYINGQPTCVFSVFPAHGTTAHEYWYGRFNGTTWDTEKICDAGTTATADYLYASEAQYSGGVCLDPTDEDVVYVSREYSATDFRIHKFTTPGAWAASTWLSEGSPGINARPVAVDADGTTHVFWWVGRYTNYTSFSTVVFASPAPVATVTGSPWNYYAQQA